ncbi:hypothetical protein SK128_011016 [Halocaridina rubra]|uniref:Uncharacterized protein n=1 Tax=Halocaridina rubra TaxID=373956 RepID=A0AAN8XEU0_HALRR
MGRSSHCTDKSVSYKSPHSTYKTKPLGECYAASAMGEGCNSQFIRAAIENIIFANAIKKI